MNHTSYTDYLNEVVDLAPDNIDKSFKSIFYEKLLPVVEKYWTEYLVGNRDSYYLSEDDIELAWKDSFTDIIQNSLNNLSDMGFVNVSVKDNGDIVYSISDKGQDFLKSNE